MKNIRYELISSTLLQRLSHSTEFTINFVYPCILLSPVTYDPSCFNSLNSPVNYPLVNYTDEKSKLTGVGFKIKTHTCLRPWHATRVTPLHNVITQFKDFNNTVDGSLTLVLRVIDSLPATFFVEAHRNKLSNDTIIDLDLRSWKEINTK